MREIELPDHTTIWTFNAFEARLIHREIAIDRTYDAHGITVPPGGTVFDVGANIGLYARHLAASIPGVRVRCFEPVARTFSALEKNLAGLSPAITAVHAGLGATARTAIFQVDRYSTITSSMTPTVFADASDRSATALRWADAALADAERVHPTAITRWTRRGLARPLSRPLFMVGVACIAAGLELRKRLFLRTEPCAIRTLSSELSASGFNELDLVKIDVEGAEEEVLAGIDEHDWPRIRQLVIEVHDVGGRRDRISGQLRGRGYHVTHDREDWALHELMGISTIYAVRA